MRASNHSLSRPLERLERRRIANTCISSLSTPFPTQRYRRLRIKVSVPRRKYLQKAWAFSMPWHEILPSNRTAHTYRVHQIFKSRVVVKQAPSNHNFHEALTHWKAGAFANTEISRNRASNTTISAARTHGLFASAVHTFRMSRRSVLHDVSPGRGGVHMPGANPAAAVVM